MTNNEIMSTKIIVISEQHNVNNTILVILHVHVHVESPTTCIMCSD